MSTDNLIYVAMVIFALMLVGLGLTIIEFRSSRMEREADQKLDPRKR